MQRRNSRSQDALNKPKCIKCGHCCHSLILEVHTEDLEGEPCEYVIKEKAILLSDNETYSLLAKTDEGIQCVFLDENNLCSIYEIRPDMCRDFKPGSSQCWQES